MDFDSNFGSKIIDNDEIKPSDKSEGIPTYKAFDDFVFGALTLIVALILFCTVMLAFR